MTHDNPPDNSNRLDGSARNNLTLIHGLGVDHRMWARQLPFLATAYHVFNPDLPGFGKEPAVISEKSRAVAALADWLARKMAERGIHEAVVAGYSFGATVALALAANHPALVSRLVLSAGATDWGGGIRSLGAAFPRFSAKVLEKAAIWELTALLEDKAEKELVKDMFKRADPGTMAALVGELARTDYTGFCSSVKCPVMVISGERDRLADRSRISRLLSALPDASHFEISGGRHYFCLTHSRLLAEKIIGFGADGLN